MNPRKTLAVNETIEPYVPKLDLVYPSSLDRHTEDLKITHNVMVDKDYPFLDKSFRFRFVRFLMYMVIFAIVSRKFESPK